MFGDGIDYAQPRILHAKWAFFQGRDYAMSPDGNIYWPACPADCSQARPGMMDVFIHEMAHVYQFQCGQCVWLRAGVLQAAKVASRLLTGGRRVYDPYHCSYVPGKRFRDYNLEQQGEIAVAIYRGRIPNIILEP